MEMHMLQENATELVSSTVSFVLQSQPDEGVGFFDTYFSCSRFVIETIMAVVSTTANILSIAALRHVHLRVHSIYHLLFANMALANAMTSILSWFCNNTMFLFGFQLQKMAENSNFCDTFLILSATAFISFSFGVVATLTLLGFTGVQYIAMSRPLDHVTLIRRRRVKIFIGATWIVTICGAGLPLLVLLGNTSHQQCSHTKLKQMENSVVIGSNISVSVVAVVYVSVVILCIKIYREIKSLQRRLAQFRSDHDIEAKRKSFRTIVLLVVILTLFFIPYDILYVISINGTLKSVTRHHALVYYMNFLPYIKYLADPITYGMSMQDVLTGWKSMFYMCCFKQCKPQSYSNRTIYRSRGMRGRGVPVDTRVRVTREVRTGDMELERQNTPLCTSHKTHKNYINLAAPKMHCYEAP